MATTMMHSAEDVAQVFAEGMAAFKVGELDKAITAFKSIIKIEPISLMRITIWGFLTIVKQSLIKQLLP